MRSSNCPEWQVWFAFQVCDYCDRSQPDKMHPAQYAVDGAETWWQSPPLSRGVKYNEVNLTIDLGQVSSNQQRLGNVSLLWHWVEEFCPTLVLTGEATITLATTYGSNIDTKWWVQHWLQQVGQTLTRNGESNITLATTGGSNIDRKRWVQHNIGYNSWVKHWQEMVIPT